PSLLFKLTRYHRLDKAPTVGVGLCPDGAEAMMVRVPERLTEYGRATLPPGAPGPRRDPLPGRRGPARRPRRPRRVAARPGVRDYSVARSCFNGHRPTRSGLRVPLRGRVARPRQVERGLAPGGGPLRGRVGRARAGGASRAVPAGPTVRRPREPRAL